MGMDIEFGIIYGIKVQTQRPSLHDSLIEELGFEESTETRYNAITGKPYEMRVLTYMVKMRHDFGDLKKESVISLDSFRSYLREIAETPWDDSLHYDEECVGYKAFQGEFPYESPQDVAFEYIPETEIAKKKWEEKFPGIPGRLIIFCHVSE